MMQQLFFPSADVPERLQCQILSFVRIEWPELFSGVNRLRDWTSKPELHPVTFLLEEEGVLVSRVEVVWDLLLHQKTEYLTYGLSGMFTYPAFRKHGYALQLVQAAKQYILHQGNADIILVHSTLQGFYEQAGFERMDRLVTLVENANAPKQSDETAFMLFLSEKGQQARNQFEVGPLFLAEGIW